MSENKTFLVTVSQRQYAELVVEAPDERAAVSQAEGICDWDTITDAEYTVSDEWVVEKVELATEQLALFEIPT